MLVSVLAPLDFWTSQLTACVLAKTVLCHGYLWSRGTLLEQKRPASLFGASGECWPFVSAFDQLQ